MHGGLPGVPDGAPVPVQYYLRFSLHDHPVCANRAKLMILRSYHRLESNPRRRPRTGTEVVIARDDPHLHFIDADPVLLTAEGKVNAELLRFDGIHLNDKGYAAWTSLIKPALLAAYGPAAGSVQ